METPPTLPPLSRFAVLAGLLSGFLLFGFAAVFGLGTLAVGGVPVFGLLALLTWVPAAALVFLVLSALVWGLSAAASGHIRERTSLGFPLRGLAWTLFGRVAGGVGVAASVLLLLGTVVLPTLVVRQESIAWRQTADHGIASFEATASKLDQISASLDKGVAALQAMGPNVSPFDRAKLAALFSDQAAKLQELTASLSVQARSWQNAIAMALTSSGASMTDAAKWMTGWMQHLWWTKDEEPKK